MKRVLMCLAIWLMAVSAFGQPTGSITTTACPGTGCFVVLLPAATGSVSVQISGTFVGTIEFEQTTDSVTYVSWPVVSSNAIFPITPVTNTTTTGQWVGNTAAQLIRLRFSAFTSGTANITARPNPVEFPLIAAPTATGSTLTTATSATLTASVNIKATAGSVYGVFAMNGAASTCWVQFINSSGAGTLGTGVVFSVPLPASTTQPVYVSPNNFALASFSSGIAVGISTTATGSAACGTGGNVVTFYK